MRRRGPASLPTVPCSKESPPGRRTTSSRRDAAVTSPWSAVTNAGHTGFHAAVQRVPPHICGVRAGAGQRGAYRASVPASLRRAVAFTAEGARYRPLPRARRPRGRPRRGPGPGHLGVNESSRQGHVRLTRNRRATEMFASGCVAPVTASGRGRFRRSSRPGGPDGTASARAGSVSVRRVGRRCGKPVWPASPSGSPHALVGVRARCAGRERKLRQRVHHRVCRTVRSSAVTALASCGGTAVIPRHIDVANSGYGAGRSSLTASSSTSGSATEAPPA